MLKRVATIALMMFVASGCNRSEGEESRSRNENGEERSERRSAERERDREGDDSDNRSRREERRGDSKRGQIPAPDDVAAPPDGAERTESGLASKVIEAGSGDEHPSERDRVKVHYTGWTTDGEMFDSSLKRGRPAVFPLSKVIKGWTEGVQLMVKGEKRRFWIPEELAYKGRRGAPQGMLVFDIELIDFQRAPEPLPAPDDVSAPPANAEKTESGLASRVLQKGTGSRHPGETSRVKVHYTGWTTDGEMFDSSVVRDRPATFPLNRVIKGWTEGVQLMVEGEKRRLWIPEEMAYKGRRGAPQGMLVFDIELLEILDE